MILLTSLFIVGCTNNNVEEERNDDRDKQAVEEVKEEAKVFIEEGPETIAIRSENSGIKKLSLVALEYDPVEDELLEKETLKEEENIEVDEKITWEVIYSEGIPSMKLLWELQSGETGEYLIAYDGKDGLKEEEIKVFPENDK